MKPFLLFTIAAAIGLSLLILAGARDEFPGRRQGGGSQSHIEVERWGQK